MLDSLFDNAPNLPLSVETSLIALSTAVIMAAAFVASVKSASMLSVSSSAAPPVSVDSLPSGPALSTPKLLVINSDPYLKIFCRSLDLVTMQLPKLYQQQEKIKIMQEKFCLNIV